MAKVAPIALKGRDVVVPTAAVDKGPPKTAKAKQPQQDDRPLTCSDVYTVGLLLVINLVNFADRLTIPPVLTQIDDEFEVKDQMILGLLQTVFVVTYMIFSPIFGYLGDRFNRRYLMAIGLFAWGAVSLGSAFVTRDIPNGFWLFMGLRGVIGIGEASYVTISPTIISDLFVGRRRTIVLVIYQSAMLLGSGVGYMMASAVTEATGSWHYAFMVWPFVVFVCAIGLFFMKEPERGKAEGTTNLEASSYWEDIKYLLKVKSYVYTSLGYTCTVFVVGVFSFWAPTFAIYQILLDNPDNNTSSVGFIFGLLTILGGMAGSIGGAAFAKFLKIFKCIGENGDVMACAIGAMLAGPLIFFNIAISTYSTIAMWIMLFFSLTFLSINLVLTQEITLYVLIPTRRATGTGVQMLVSHLLGDAISPYLIGAIVDGFRYSAFPPRNPNSWENFIYLQDAFFFTTLICIIGGFCFFIGSLYVLEEKHEATALAASMSAKSLAAMGGIETSEGVQMYPTPQPPPYPGQTTTITAPSPPSPASSGYMSSSHLQMVQPIATISSPSLPSNLGDYAHNSYYTTTGGGNNDDYSSESTAL